MEDVAKIKGLRKALDEQIQEVRSLPASRETSICITKLQEAVMWLGMELKRRGDANPYPSSKDPDNPTIEPTAQGMKL